MADLDVARKPGGEMTWLWAAVAVLAVAGLMTWLAVQSDRVTTAAVVEENRRAAEEEVVEAEPAELGMVATTPDLYAGRQLYIEDVEVAAALGPSAFWGDVPGANPFLVLFSPNLTEQPAINIGASYNIQGVINVVTDSLVQVWVESGAIRPQARDEAGFATHYLLAERIRP